ncbi:MAG: ABC transporter permease [Haliscomenobacteraceae bacterium CHB4]|nr:ABC transporter permease [Haliscomenobacteraceae bacterium CHB4]
MLRRQLSFAFRALRRDRIYALLNLAGLATGLAAALLVLLWVQDELTFDRSHRQGKNIVRVLTNWDFGGKREWTETTPANLAPAAKAELPEIQEAVREWNFHVRTFQIGAALVEAEKVLIVDKGFFDLFDFPLLRSDGSAPLSTPNGILLTETLARKFFADADPLGKTLRFDNKIDLVVTGILKDPPSNSSIQFSCLMPWEPVANQLVRDPKQAFHWGMMSYTTWFLLRPEADREALAHKLAALVARHRNQPDDGEFWYALQPLHQVYLDSGMLSWASADQTGDRRTIAVFGLIGLLVLAIACINYVNLATARATTRAKEVGVRKAIGAGRGELFVQFMAESALLILVATGMAMLLAAALLPTFNELSGKHFSSAQFLQPVVLRVVAGTAVLALLLAGIYPALLLTRFNPVAVLKGQFFSFGKSSGSTGAALRKTLVTGQFVFSLILITSAFIISRQMAYVREAKLGFERENVIFMSMYGKKAPAAVVKDELQGKPGIASVSMSDNNIVGIGSQNGGMDWEGKPPGKEMPIWQLGVDGDFQVFFGLQLAEGRWFRPELNGWDTTSFIINEAAAREMGIQDGATGKWVDYNGIKGTIAGVVKDFNFRSLHDAVEPLILYQNPEWTDAFYIKTAAGKTPEAIASMQAVFEKFNPGKVFKYKFLDEQYDQQYKAETRTGLLFNLFAGLAVLISCLGLLGLATFAAQHRAKEIGIRKVLGASVGSITGLLAKDFLKLIVLAIVIASPVVFWAMNKWLQDFAYRIEIEWWVFAAAGAVAMALAFLTVGFQSVKAALANPVKSLRSE